MLNSTICHGASRMTLPTGIRRGPIGRSSSGIVVLAARSPASAVLPGSPTGWLTAVPAFPAPTVAVTGCRVDWENRKAGRRAATAMRMIAAAPATTDSGIPSGSALK